MVIQRHLFFNRKGGLVELGLRDGSLILIEERTRHEGLPTRNPVARCRASRQLVVTATQTQQKLRRGRG
jgi:hypothetical protein